MKKLFPILLFIALACSGNSLPLENQTPFFRAPPASSGGGGGGGGTYTFLNATSIATSANNSATTSALDTTTAKLYTVCLSYHSGTGITLSDSKGNTYVLRTDNVDTTAGNMHNRIYDCISPVTDAATTWTVQIASGTGYPTIHVQTFSYSGTTPVFDKKADYSGNGGSATSTPQVTSVTPTAVSELAVSAITTDHSANSVSSPFLGLLNDGNSGILESAAYLIQSGTANPVAPTFTLSGNTTVVSGGTALYQ